MQALTRHLRPAPYPYGLLTLRLLGKLGGKNRAFFREPLAICSPKDASSVESFCLPCSWAATPSAREGELSLALPVDRCAEILKRIPSKRMLVAAQRTAASTPAEEGKSSTILWDEFDRLWTENLAALDYDAYCEDVVLKTCERQARACMAVLTTAASMLVARR